MTALQHGGDLSASIVKTITFPFTIPSGTRHLPTSILENYFDLKKIQNIHKRFFL